MLDKALQRSLDDKTRILCGRRADKMNIVKVFSSLNETVYFGVSEWNFIKETNYWYEIQSEIKTKRLKKEELNEITSDTKEPYISFSSFCTPDKVEEVKEKMLVLMEQSLARQEMRVFERRAALNKYKEQ
jgi:hypothetical protein